jgi:prepilin-type N-terminal cleavage/methylation domain-containing protein
MKTNGYTLMELLIAILLLAIILLGGTALFYRNLRSSGLGDVDLGLNTGLRAVLSIMEKDIRYSEVESVGVGLRSDCLSAAATGYTGSNLTTTDTQGLTTVYSLDEGRIASTAAETGKKAYLSPTTILITGLNFTWYCQSGVSDKIKIVIDASSSALGSGLNIIRSVSREVNLLNSGIN